MFPQAVYYEPDALSYPLGRSLRDKYKDIRWTEIESHNSIPQLQKSSNREFPQLKKLLIIGVRKTHKYTENHKVSDFLVPYTSSGCSAMCLYCYLVCNYNKCSYMRVFVNREQMMERLIKHSAKAERLLTYEVGSNSDLVLENTITGNLPWTIEEFAKKGRGHITFPTKFDSVQALLPLEHQGKTIFRMSVNPEDIIRRVEYGTSPLPARIQALNQMNEAGYKTGLLIAPVILQGDWRTLYGKLIEELAETLSARVKKSSFIEIIFMTYSYVQNAINTEAFPHAPVLYDKQLQTGRGRGKYCYKQPLHEEGEVFFRERLGKILPEMKILYVA